MAAPFKTKIKLEKGIPYTPPNPAGRPHKYQWDTMQVGDSFLFPPKLEYKSAYKSAKINSKKYGVEFKIGRTEEGIRCWRLK